MLNKSLAALCMYVLSREVSIYTSKKWNVYPHSIWKQNICRSKGCARMSWMDYTYIFHTKFITNLVSIDPMYGAPQSPTLEVLSFVRLQAASDRLLSLKKSHKCVYVTEQLYIGRVHTVCMYLKFVARSVRGYRRRHQMWHIKTNVNQSLWCKCMYVCIDAASTYVCSMYVLWLCKLPFRTLLGRVHVPVCMYI